MHTARRAHRSDVQVPIVLLGKIVIILFGLLAVVLVEPRAMTHRSWAYILALTGRRVLARSGKEVEWERNPSLGSLCPSSPSFGSPQYPGCSQA